MKTTNLKGMLPNAKNDWQHGVASAPSIVASHKEMEVLSGKTGFKPWPSDYSSPYDTCQCIWFAFRYYFVFSIYI